MKTTLLSSTTSLTLTPTTVCRRLKRLVAVAGSVAILLSSAVSSSAASSSALPSRATYIDAAARVVRLIDWPMTVAERQKRHAQNFNGLTVGARVTYLRAVSYYLAFRLSGGPALTYTVLADKLMRSQISEGAFVDWREGAVGSYNDGVLAFSNVVSYGYLEDLLLPEWIDGPTLGNLLSEFVQDVFIDYESVTQILEVEQLAAAFLEQLNAYLEQQIVSCDDQSYADAIMEGAAAGMTGGMILGGAIGSLAGPEGTAAGAAVGGAEGGLGGAIGAAVVKAAGDAWDWLTGKGKKKDGITPESEAGIPMLTSTEMEAIEHAFTPLFNSLARYYKPAYTY